MLSIECFIDNYPALEIASLQLALETDNILLKAYFALQLSSLEVPFDILVIELIDGQLAQIGLGMRDGVFSVTLIDVP